jgi:integrase
VDPIPGLVFRTHHGTPGCRAVDSTSCASGCAMLLLAAGTDLKVVSQILGHSTIALTANRYGGVLPALQREASDRRAALLGSPAADHR